jgi:hypothetical protein
MDEKQRQQIEDIKGEIALTMVDEAKKLIALGKELEEKERKRRENLKSIGAICMFSILIGGVTLLIVRLFVVNTIILILGIIFLSVALITFIVFAILLYKKASADMKKSQ